jgi:cholesterol transport system auxiliary component
MTKLLISAPNRRGFLLASGAALTLAGCAGMIGPTAAPQLYVLRPHLGPASGAAKVDWALTVALPNAPLSLDTARIALQRSADTMDYYANSAWQDRVPVLVQRALIEGFEKSGKIAAVARDTEGVRADYLLQTDLRAFEARYSSPDGAPEIVVEITARLLRTPGRKIARTLQDRKTAQASANSVPAVVAAFDGATAAAVDAIVAWALNAPAPAEGA